MCIRDRCYYSAITMLKMGSLRNSNKQSYGPCIHTCLLYTSGPNNAAFQLKYTELAKTMAPDTYSILLVNVNGFKLINERLGIPTGNRILAYLYQVLERQLRPADDEFAARVESDHFFLCLKEHEPERLQNRLDEMIREINAFRLSLIHIS